MPRSSSRRSRSAALDDDRLVAVSQPVRLQTGDVPRVIYLSGGVMVAASAVSSEARATPCGATRRGPRRRLWLARSRCTRSLRSAISSSGAPAYRRSATPGRVSKVDGVFRDDRFPQLWPYRPLWKQAQRLTAASRSPYEATIATRELASRDRQLRLHRDSSRAASGGAAARRLRDAVEAGVLPALRGDDGGDAPAPRDPGAGRGRVHERPLDGRRVGRHRSSGARLGRGMVRRDTAGCRSIRPRAAARSRRTTRWRPTRPTPCGRSEPGAFSSRMPFRPTPRPSPPVASTPVDESGSVPGWLVLGISLLLGYCALVATIKALRRRRRLGRDDPRQAATGLRLELIDLLRDHGLAISHTTPLAVVRQQSRKELGVDLRALERSLGEARYGRLEPARAALDDARTRVRAAVAGAPRGARHASCAVGSIPVALAAKRVSRGFGSD